MNDPKLELLSAEFHIKKYCDDFHWMSVELLADVNKMLEKSLINNKRPIKIHGLVHQGMMHLVMHCVDAGNEFPLEQAKEALETAEKFELAPKSRK